MAGFSLSLSILAAAWHQFGGQCIYGIWRELSSISVPASVGVTGPVTGSTNVKLICPPRVPDRRGTNGGGLLMCRFINPAQ